MSNPDSTICYTCKCLLPRSSFNKDRKRSNGLVMACRECKKKSRQTPLHRAIDKWASMNSRVRNKSEYTHVEIRITRAIFIAWAVPLLEAWDHRIGSPSVDRIDPKGHYELSNMQIISQSKNCGKDKKSRTAPVGTKWCPDCDGYRPFSEFGKHRSSAFGLESHCRKHKNARQRRKRASLKASV